METLEVVKVYKNKVWAESDFFGSKHVMVQSEAPGCEPCCDCSFHYCYGHTDNRSVHDAALRMAVSLGAVEPVEFRMREMKVPNAELSGPPAPQPPKRGAAVGGSA